VIGKSHHKRYSQKALDALSKAKKEVNLDEVWEKHRPSGKRQRVAQEENRTAPLGA
jgi:hypothetical protein